ncbi:MAG: acyl-CoA dehydrogenase family protein [Pseudomonadota bacterium]
MDQIRNITPDEDEALILDSVRQFLKRDVEPYAHELEAKDEYPQEIADKMAELGLFGTTIGPEYGGLGLSCATFAKIMEEIARVWMSVGGIIGAHLVMARAVEHFGTDEMKQEYLPKFASGELRGGIGLTEPDAGTDLQGIRTRADRDGDDYVINGAKMWITNSVKGNILAVLVKTDPKADPAYKGMSLVLVPREAGYVPSKLEKLGYRGVDTGGIEFKDVRVPVKNLIGPAEGQGLQQILNGLEQGRINVAARGVGVARAALEEALAYAQTRKTFGKPICEHQSIQIKLADMATRVEAAQLLTAQAATAYDEGRRADLEAGMAKLFASEAAMENSAEAMRIHGAYGYSKEYNVERYYRDAPLLAIGEGTNELQRIIIARQLVKRHPV